MKYFLRMGRSERGSFRLEVSKVEVLWVIIILGCYFENVCVDVECGKREGSLEG